MSAERGSNHFVKGAAILGIAGLLSKLMGAVYRIPYQNITGDIGLYVYMQVYPLYTALLILATAGFPIAISKIVSERLALGDPAGARKAFRIASVSLGILGLLFFLLLFFGAPMIGRMMGDEHLTLPLQAVSWSLLLVPMVSIMRGYFQGQQNMMPTGVSQVVEQLVRVVFIIAAAYWMMAVYHDAYLAGTGAVFAALPGAVGALLVLLYYWRRNAGTEASAVDSAKQTAAVMTNREIFNKILHYAIPICLGALVLPMIPLIDSVTVSNLLQWSGIDPEAAKDLKGTYDRSQPLIQFGTFFATSLSLALVPAISEAMAQGQTRLVSNRTEIALRLTLLLGLPASVGLALLAESVNVMVYGNDKGTLAIAVQSFTILFATLMISSSGILQGIGQVKLPARHLMIGVVVKLLANLALIPLWGIVGSAVATVLAYVVAMILNIMAIHRHIGLVISLKQLVIKPLIAVGMMGIIVVILEYGLLTGLGDVITHVRLLHTVAGLIAVGAGALVYGVALLYTGGITRQDMRFIPRGEKLIALLTRFKLLRD
ncbi:putative polysaccharide biosynthesis protein [Brevibacillus dissolubilis]|uniref:putative polysaccharide biosynthesis protein n=1 Tax=Brevibacillus dissolubilis TaxID=1844116 RepID=UPI0011161275|nr:polysaccharide biosynthesis protein [Brevibacillus dissolubilis]